MNRNVIYIRVLLVIIAVVVLLAVINRSPQHSRRDTWLPSTFNPVGSGNMAFFQTLRDLNWPVERWREPLSRLSAYGTGNLLIITRAKEGERVTFSDQETDLLDDWVRKGNTVMLLGAVGEWDDTRQFLEQMNIVFIQKKNSASDLFQLFETPSRTPVEIQPAANTGNSGTLVLPETPLPAMTLPPGARTLWQDQGRAYIIDVPHGAGHVVCCSSELLLSNHWLGQGDNLAIVIHLLTPSGHVPNHLLFEESHHGFSSVYAVARLLEHPGVRFAGMLALLGILAFLGSSLVRFGPVVPLQRETGRSTLEFVDSIADLYLRADIRNDTIKYLFDETHQRILYRLNLPPTASHVLIASRLQQANPHLPKWKKLAQRFDSDDYMDGLPPSGWLRVARDLIEIKSAMA